MLKTSEGRRLLGDRLSPGIDFRGLLWAAGAHLAMLRRCCDTEPY